jgi:hypothetical protein
MSNQSRQPSSDPPPSDPSSDPSLSDPSSNPPLSDPSSNPPPRSLSSARPLPQDVIDKGYRYTTAQRIHCLSLLAEDCFTAAYIEAKTGVKERSQRNIRRKAIERGFDSKEDSRILESYVIDGKRSGRLKEITTDQEEKLLSIVRNDHSGREKLSKVLAYETNMSSTSALRILAKNEFKNVKPTTKPGLTPWMKQARYQ